MELTFFLLSEAWECIRVVSRRAQMFLYCKASGPFGLAPNAIAIADPS